MARTSERICPAQKRSPRRRLPDTAHERKDLPRAETLSSAKASRHGARAKRFAPRRNTPHGEGLPTRRTSERICPAQEHAPRRRHPDTAHERKGLSRAETLPTAKASRHGARAKGFARAGTRPSAKASRHGARAKGFAPREFALAPRADERRAALDRRTAGKTPLRRGRTRDRARAKEFARARTLPRRRPPDTAHERKDLSREGTRPSAKASRHGARAKGFVPRRNTPLDEGLPTRRTGERICPAQEHAPRRRPPDTAHERKDLPAREGSPRRRPPDTAHERKDLPRAGTLPSAKASRHGARAKGFAPRESAPHGESLPTRRTSERICPAQKRSPRRKPPDTAHERKGLPRGGSPSPHMPTNGGPPSTDEQPEKHPFGGVAPETARPLPSSFTEKK